MARSGQARYVGVNAGFRIASRLSNSGDRYGGRWPRVLNNGRTIKFYATMVRVICVCGNINSTTPRIFNQCLKNLERRDFFNSLSHDRK